MTQHDDHPKTRGHHARWGLILFSVYVVCYTGFIILAAFDYQAMKSPTPFGSVNLAIMYGMGLILAALLLALIYLFLCRPQNNP